MAWRLVITDAELRDADLDLLDSLDGAAEEFCANGGTIFTHEQPWRERRVLFGPGEAPTFLVSDHMLNPTTE